MHTIQIDAIQQVTDKALVTCRVYTEFGNFLVAISRDVYDQLIEIGFFLRDGKTTDSAGVTNTTRTYTAQP